MNNSQFDRKLSAEHCMEELLHWSFRLYQQFYFWPISSLFDKTSFTCTFITRPPRFLRQKDDNLGKRLLSNYKGFLHRDGPAIGIGARSHASIKPWSRDLAAWMMTGRKAIMKVEWRWMDGKLRRNMYRRGRGLTEPSYKQSEEYPSWLPAIKPCFGGK